MDQPIIDIYDNNGLVGRYKRLSVRLPCTFGKRA